MAAPISPRFNLPKPAETYIGNPVLGRTLTALGGALNHLNVVHARGFSATSVYQRAAFASGNAADVGYRIGEVDAAETLVFPYYVPPGVDRLHASIWAMSYATGGTGAEPTLTMSIGTASGSPVDVGCVWDRADGTLPGAEFLSAGNWLLRPFHVESAARYTTGDESSGSPTQPRWLVVGAEAGSVVVVTVAALRAAVVSVSLLPVVPVSV